MSTTVDEVTPTAQSTDPKSAQNGLGLEQMFTPTKKPSPPKDPVTGKFLKADGTKGEPKPPKADVKGDDKTPVDPITNLEKRLKDTRDYATRVESDNRSLKERLKVLEAKIDGTYVEPIGPSPDQLEEQRRWMERATTDRQAMYDQYGEETVNARLFHPDSQYQKLEQSDPLITERLKRANRPVLEAWKILEKHEFEEKYGKEPDAIKAAIIAEYQQQQEAEIKAELKQHGQRTITAVPTLAGVSGVPREQTPKPAGKTQPDMKVMFPVFPQPSY
jgi:hypothetical protein